jgi:hypothetical protein
MNKAVIVMSIVTSLSAPLTIIGADKMIEEIKASLARDIAKEKADELGVEPVQKIKSKEKVEPEMDPALREIKRTAYDKLIMIIKSRYSEDLGGWPHIGFDLHSKSPLEEYRKEIKRGVNLYTKAMAADRRFDNTLGKKKMREIAEDFESAVMSEMRRIDNFK